MYTCVRGGVAKSKVVPFKRIGIILANSSKGCEIKMCILLFFIPQVPFKDIFFFFLLLRKREKKVHIFSSLYLCYKKCFLFFIILKKERKNKKEEGIKKKKNETPVKRISCVVETVRTKPYRSYACCTVFSNLIRDSKYELQNLLLLRR
eukprot:TRINITY_DN12490_c1_g1_i1.p1 TRINITY_DN12490_c1_g1~~TRINITY_DN12490_c1_g1_i1.p1  ORF type:complete len:149 (+),score=8.79 TRINITY_DN12490_c1_g1_i1:122-568(+)